MVTRSVLTALKKGLIFDSAMGSMLIDAELAAGRASESWVIERPVEVKKVMGNPVPACMTAILEAGAAVVGANCTLDSERMIALAQVIRRVVKTPILIFPNAGSLDINNGKPHYTEDADTFAENMLRIKSLGVEAIGGCCGTTPTHIRHMREKVHQHCCGFL